MTGKPDKITAASIRSAMAKRWAAPEYALMWEVADTTGASTKRFADAVIMSLWPSRGLELHGVEIKVSRSDWKREATDPKKAEAIAQYCDRWYVHTAPGVVADISEVPPAWGLREFDGKTWRTIREAEKRQPVAIDRAFLASILRRADTTMRLLIEEANREARRQQEEEMQRWRDEREKHIEYAVNQRTAQYAESAKNYALFQETFGPRSLTNYAVDHAALGKAARALVECGPKNYGQLAQKLRAAADQIDAIAALSDPRVPTETVA